VSEPTQEQPEVTPAVTTQPAGSGWSRIPDHLGRARTSTVVLTVLFVAVFVLYLYIRPETPGTVPAGTTSNPAPVSTTAPAPKTSATSTSVAPETTQSESTQSESTQSESTARSTPTAGPTTSAVPTRTTPSAPETTTAPTPTGATSLPTPTGSTPTG
jgi:hypothetical protein